MALNALNHRNLRPALTRDTSDAAVVGTKSADPQTSFMPRLTIAFRALFGQLGEWLWVRLGLKGVLVDHQLSGPRLQQKRNAPVPSCGENRRGYSDASIGTAHSPARYQYRQQACGPHSHRLGALTQRSAKYVRFPDRAIASEADKDSGEE